MKNETQILSIDPGNEYSAYTLLNNDLSLAGFGKYENDYFFELLDYHSHNSDQIKIVIEMISSYGMAVGRSVFDTCVYIGRFMQYALSLSYDVHLIYRKDVKMNLCYSMRAKDTNIKQALIDRFASGVSNHGKGTKKDKGFFYGFKSDIWQAYALGVTYYDTIYKKIC